MLERSGTEKIPEVAPCFRSAAGLCHCTYHVGVDGCFKGCFDESSDLDAGLHAGGLGKLNCEPSWLCGSAMFGPWSDRPWRAVTLIILVKVFSIV